MNPSYSISRRKIPPFRCVSAYWLWRRWVLNMIKIWLVILFLGLALPLTASAAPPKQLRDLLPSIQWEKQALTLDCDCDGRNDHAYLGRFKGRVFVGFASGTGSKVDLLDFSVNPNVQAAICSEPAKLEVESLDVDLTRTIGNIDGFVRSKTCQGLRLSGGGCDAIHIFWNRKTKSLNWWRL